MPAVVGHLVSQVSMRETASLTAVKITMPCLLHAVVGVVSPLWIAISRLLVHTGTQNALYAR